MHYHIVGIGGIGVSALAQLLAHHGNTVTGSDAKETEVFPILKQAGIDAIFPQKAENIPADTECVIYSAAVPENNPERMEATKRGIPQFSYFEYLGKVSRDARTIAVTGTHGKTSTVALLSAGMVEAGADPSVVIGTRMPMFGGSNFRAGESNWLLVEACEYRGNFMAIEPEIVLLTNAELDHPDYYESLEHYLETFKKFVQKAKTIICHKGDENAEKILKGYEGKIVWVEKEVATSLDLFLPGEHNRSNGALCIALAQEIKLDEKSFREGMKAFRGAARRLEYLGIKNAVHIYDDYGHHPTEIRATIQSLREKYPQSTIGLVFEPHQFARTKVFFEDFLDCFDVADLVGMHPIYAARDTEEDKKAVSINDFIARNPNILRVDTQKAAEGFAEKLKDGDVLIFMGAGVIDSFAHTFMGANS